MKFRLLSNKGAILMALVVICFYISPFVILGEDAYLTIFDFLDYSVAHVKAAITLGLVGQWGGLLPVLDGPPSSIVIHPFPLDFKSIFYLALPTFWAIVVNIFFVKVIAFGGMFLLLYRYILNKNTCLAFVVSTMFCLIPFYEDYGLSAAGIPLVLYALINLENKINIFESFSLLLFFTLNSSFVLVGYCICFLWIIWIIRAVIQNKNIPYYHVVGLLIVICGYLYTTIPVIYNSHILGDFISHRVEFVRHTSFCDEIRFVLNILIESQFHAGSFFALPLLLLSFFVFFSERKYTNKIRLSVYLFLIIVFLILLGRLFHYIPIKQLSNFQFDRAYFLFPTVCFILLAEAILVSKKKKVVVALSLALFFIGFVFYDKGFRKNVRILAHIDNHKYPTFRQFFDTDLFSIIKKDICENDKPYNCKVVSLGLYPSMAEYNGFYTLDSYMPSYSLNYKHQFKKVMEDELLKNDNMYRYFNDWGSRCYLCSSEMTDSDFLIPRDKNKHVKHITINTKELKALNCDYILSAVDIDNYKELNLSYINAYTTDQSFYKIRVYKVN